MEKQELCKQKGAKVNKRKSLSLRFGIFYIDPLNLPYRLKILMNIKGGNECSVFNYIFYFLQSLKTL